MKTATLIRESLPGFQGDARLYRLDPPAEWTRYDDDGEPVAVPTTHVVVSAADAMYSGPETYIFPADGQGKVTSWGEMDGSFRGAFDHARALQGLGYEVTQDHCGGWVLR